MTLKSLLMEEFQPPTIDFEILGKVFQAVKKQKMQVVTTLENMPNNSLYMKTDATSLNVNTSIGKNTQESVAKAKVGAWIACGVKGEKWVIRAEDLKKLYRISGSTATPIQKKSFIKIKAINNLDWKNAWNESKHIPKGAEYYLMANTSKDIETYNWKEINPMDVSAFNATY